MGAHLEKVLPILIFLLAFLWLCIVWPTHGQPNKRLSAVIQKLVKQSARWAVASENDTSPLIKVLHSNYAAGYLWAVTDIATSEEIKTATGVDVLVFTKKITDIQDKANKYVINDCPQYIGEVDMYLAQIGETPLGL